MFEPTDLIKRIDEEIATEVAREKAAADDWKRWSHERGERLKRYDADARRIIDLLKPRLETFVEHLKPVVKVEPVIREHTSSVKLCFASNVAKVTLRFDVVPDQEVEHVHVECTQEILPVLTSYDKEASIQFRLGNVQYDELVQWFDDRVITFVKAYLAILRQDAKLSDQLKEDFVEDPVANVRFPKFLAKCTLNRDGKTYYFVDEESQREFEHLLAMASR